MGYFISQVICVPEKKLPSVEDILNFSVNYVCGLFETNKDERGVLYEKISPAGERSLIRRFSLRDKIEGGCSSKRLFLATSRVLVDRYCVKDGFPNGGGDPKSREHYWELNGRPLDRATLKREVLEKYRIYLEANLEQCSIA